MHSETVGGRTVILNLSQGRGIGRGEDRAIGVRCPWCEEEFEDVFDGFGSHGESKERRKEALR